LLGYKKRRIVKVAVTSQGQDPDCAIDPHFGRARYVLVVDTNTGSFVVRSNTGPKRTLHTAGIQSAGALISMGAEAVISGHIGPKAFATLEAANVKVYQATTNTVNDAIERLKAGKLRPLLKADVSEHWAER
jgi:predicted Fe-Mo cluster-binding NifX family protein